MVKRILALSTAIALTSITALPVFAATTASGMVGTTANAATSAGTAVSGAVNTTGATNTSGTGSTGVTVQADGTGSNGTGSVGATVNTGANGATVNANVSGSANDTGTLMLSSSDAAVQQFNSNGTQTMTDAGMVQTSGELSSYAAGMMHADSNIQSVQSSNTAVAMSYKEQGKLFGFIPVSVSTKGQVHADGSVTISHPWYDFLVSTNDSLTQATIESRVKASMATMPAMSGSGSTFSAGMQAQVLADLYAAFSGNTSVDTSTDTNTTAATGTTGSASSTANMQGSMQDSMQSTSSTVTQ